MVVILGYFSQFNNFAKFSVLRSFATQIYSLPTVV